eukprot:gene57391-biopygen1691
MVAMPPCGELRVTGFADPTNNGRYVRDDARRVNGRETYWRGSTEVMYWCLRSAGVHLHAWMIGDGADYGDPSSIGPDVCAGYARGAEPDQHDPRRTVWMETDDDGEYRRAHNARAACGDLLKSGNLQTLTAGPVSAPSTLPTSAPVRASCAAGVEVVWAAAGRCSDANGAVAVTDADACRELVAGMGLTLARSVDQRRYAPGCLLRNDVQPLQRRPSLRKDECARDLGDCRGLRIEVSCETAVQLCSLQSAQQSLQRLRRMQHIANRQRPVAHLHGALSDAGPVIPSWGRWVHSAADGAAYDCAGNDVAECSTGYQPHKISVPDNNSSHELANHGPEYSWNHRTLLFN